MQAHGLHDATTAPHRGLIARVERMLIGIGMSAIAWLLERSVLRSTRRAARP